MHSILFVYSLLLVRYAFVCFFDVVFVGFVCVVFVCFLIGGGRRVLYISVSVCL